MVPPWTSEPFPRGLRSLSKSEIKNRFSLAREFNSRIAITTTVCCVSASTASKISITSSSLSLNFPDIDPIVDHSRQQPRRLFSFHYFPPSFCLLLVYKNCLFFFWLTANRSFRFAGKICLLSFRLSKENLVKKRTQRTVC